MSKIKSTTRYQAKCLVCSEIILNNKTGQPKLYTDPRNPQIRCSKGHKGQTEQNGEPLIEQKIVGSSTTDIENQVLDKINSDLGNRDQTIQLKVTESDGETKFNIDGIKPLMKVDDISKVNIDLKIEEKHIRALYKAFDKQAQKIEKQFKNTDNAEFYGSELPNALYDIFASFFSQITRQVKVDFKKLLLWGHVLLITPVLTWSLKSFRNKRVKKGDNDTDA